MFTAYIHSNKLQFRLVLAVFIAWSAIPAFSQDLTKSFLKNVEHYRYAKISLFEADPNANRRFRESLTPSLPPLDPEIEIECEFAEEIKKALTAKPPKKIKQDWSNETCEPLIRYYTAKASNKQITKTYVVTEQYTEGTDPVILGVLCVTNDGPSSGSTSKGVLFSTVDKPAFTFDASDLRNFKTKELTKDSTGADVDAPGSIIGTGYDNMYDYIKGAIKQSAQEVTNAIRSKPSTAEALKPREVISSLISDDDVQEHLMITEGEPHKKITGEFSDEIVIGLADIVSWRHYQKTEAGEELKLPLYGVEMRYGNDDIGYPSLWSERVAINALWDANRLGVILPSSLWAPNLLPLLTQKSKFTTLSGGVGLNGTFDFPFKLIEKSGVFTASGSLMLGNNIRYNDRGPFVNDSEVGVPDSLRLRKSFLMRWHGLLNYTFSVNIRDNNESANQGDKEVGYNVRFKVGAGGYQMEQWIPQSLGVEFVPGTDRISTLKFSPFFRIEYMSYGLSVPFGAYIQYFDGAGSGQVWLQVPISDTGFLTAIRLDGRVFVPITRSAYDWESSLVAVPSLRFIFRW